MRAGLPFNGNQAEVVSNKTLLCRSDVTTSSSPWWDKHQWLWGWWSDVADLPRAKIL